MARHFSRAPASPIGEAEAQTIRTPAATDFGTCGRTCITLCRELLARLPDAPGSELARDALAAYLALDETGRAGLFDALAADFATPAVDVSTIDRSSEPPRVDLFLRLNAAPGGISVLVDMRQRLLESIGDHPSWRSVEADLTRLLKILFNRGLLEFQQIDWETPMAVLEKLFEYEAVHEIRDWNDLRRRLDADRRCFGLFHPAWPGEPLIFIEVALTRGMSARLPPLLDSTSPVTDSETCDTAIFYSISSCQPGLSGFALGNALIGRVLDALRLELPRLTTFATLSPIPGFHAWLSALARTASDNPRLADLLEGLRRPGWHEDPTVAPALKSDLMSLCATYLLHAKKGDEPADPVARFHLSNGASLVRVNWLSDLSSAGLKRSLGLTANYLYRPAGLLRNCEAYTRTHAVMTARRVERLSWRTGLPGLCAARSEPDATDPPPDSHAHISHSRPH
jgi:malonyl-CoA decarboxylase